MTKKAPAKKIATKKVAVKVAAKRPNRPSAPAVAPAAAVSSTHTATTTTDGVAAAMAAAPALAALASLDSLPAVSRVHSHIIEVEHARALAELEVGDAAFTPTFALEKCVQRFMDDDGRVMNIVVGPDSHLYKQLAPFQGEPEAAEA